MSDESTPPPLRLKPRAQPPSEPAVSPPPAEPAPAAGDGSPKLRLKPKLGVAEPAKESPPASPTPPPATEASAPPAERVRLKPRIASEPAQPSDASAAAPAEAPAPSAAAPVESVEPPAPSVPPSADASPAAEPPKFKLKVKSSEPAPAAPAAAAPPAKPAAMPPSPPTVRPASGTRPAVPPPKPGTPPPFPLVTPAKKFPPPVPHMRAPGGVVETDLTAAAAPPPPPRRRRSSLKRNLLIATSIVVVVAVVVGYRMLTAPLPPPKKMPVVVLPKPTAPTPPVTLDQIAAAPGQAIDKARDAIAARRASEQDRIDALAAGNDVPDKRALDTPPPASLTAPVPKAPAPAAPERVTSTSQLAPGVTVTTTVSDVAGVASGPFREWVANARISGVFQGTPARALINGRMVRAGQIVDDALGIMFDGVDPVGESLVFRDKTGATVVRKF